MKNIVLFSVFIMFATSVLAQPLRKIPLRFMLEQAEESYELGDWYNAADWYKQAYDESKDKDLAIKIAQLHYKLRDYKRAENWYRRVLSRDKTGNFSYLKYDYAKTLKYMGQYVDAANNYREFIDETEDMDKKAQAQLELDGILMTGKYEENVGAMIDLASKKVNTAFTEFGPAPYSDGTLYFSSFQRKDAIVLDGKEDDYHSKIYMSEMGEKGYEKAKALDDEINREGYHTGNPNFSKDGRRMYFTRSLLEGNEVVESNLFVSFSNDGGWGPAQEVTGVNGEHQVKHPAVGDLYGNEVLFFSANIEGGQGGFDVYYSTINGDNYATPINLGPSINTPADDVTPHYRDGALYYSSEGHPGMGGFDIFQTSWDGSNWSEVTNMGTGFNSSYDDMYFNLDDEGYAGFLVSNRPADGKRSLKSKTCCDDIFTINIRRVVIDLLATVNDDKGALNGAEFTLYDVSPEGPDPSYKLGELTNQFSFLLDQDREYKVVVKREGYYPDSLTFNTVGKIDDYTYKKTITLKPIPEPEPEPEVVEILTINEPIRLGNIYYDFDDDKILPDSEQDLYKIIGLMNEYPDMVIELSSHTDAQGVSSYNKKLSQRRADSARSWMLAKGMAPERIQAVGYGEEVILNQCVNGVRCSDEEHRYNRRTEFKIIAGPQTITITKEVKKK